MANVKARLKKIESRVAPEVASDARDPGMVELALILFGADYPIEKIPCGISGVEFLRQLVAEHKPRPLPVMP